MFQKIKEKFYLLFSKKKEKIVEDFDFQDDLDKSFQKYLEVNEKYLQVASSFFSTSIEVDQKTLIKNAEQVVSQHAIVHVFSLYESINIYNRTSNQIQNALTEVANMCFWIDERGEKNQAKLKDRATIFGVPSAMPLYHYLILEKNFFETLTLYLTGISVIYTHYIVFTIEQSFKELPLLTSLESFRKRHKYSKLWLLLPFIGLMLTIVGFIPIVSTITGVIGLVMFFLENYVFEGRELRNLKRMPELAQKAQKELEAMKEQIERVRAIKEFITNQTNFLPTSTSTIINSMKNNLEVEPKVLIAECEFLKQKIIEFHNKNWPGLGKIFKEVHPEIQGTNKQRKRRRKIT